MLILLYFYLESSTIDTPINCKETRKVFSASGVAIDLLSSREGSILLLLQWNYITHILSFEIAGNEAMGTTRNMGR
jgi:hypothetical protein